MGRYTGAGPGPGHQEPQAGGGGVAGRAAQAVLLHQASPAQVDNRL